MKEIKLVAIGGGSSYTGELFDGVVRHWKAGDFLAKETILLDIPEGRDRVEKVASFARRVAAKEGMPGKIQTSFDRKEALDGATFVISQFRVGLMKARWRDEHIPVKYGIIGQETTGPGGFANALRTIPVALDVAREVKEVCPDAWLLNFTNPSGLVTEALLRHSDAKTFGLCNVPIGIKMAVAQALGVESGRVTVDVSGLNHLSFVTRIYLDGKDVTSKLFSSPLLPIYLETANIGKEMAPFIKALEIIPSSYLAYYWSRNRAVDKEKSALDQGKGTRADEVMKIEEEIFKLYADENVNTLPPELKKRGGAYYSDVALNAISAIVQNRPAIEALNVKNLGGVPGLPSDAVVEVSCLVDGRGPIPLAQKPLPLEVLGLVQKVKAYEQLTVQAAVEGSKEKAFFALLNHPLVQDKDLAIALLKDILAENKDFLPQFKDETF